MIKKEEECLLCQIDKIPLTPCKDHCREDLLQGVCVLAVQTRAVAKNMARDQMLNDSLREAVSGESEKSKKSGKSRMGILDHLSTYHGGGKVPKTPASNLGYENSPLVKNKRQKEGLHREPGKGKGVPTPSEELKQNKQDTLRSISRKLGRFVNSPRY